MTWAHELIRFKLVLFTYTEMNEFKQKFFDRHYSHTTYYKVKQVISTDLQ